MTPKHNPLTHKQVFRHISFFMCQKTDAFELWCWRRLLRVPWTARPNQSILKEINPEYLFTGRMLMLKFQYFGRLMQKAASLEKTLMLGKTEGRRRGRQTITLLDGIINGMDMSWSKLWEIVQDKVCCSPWGRKELDTTWRLNN